MSEAGGGSNGRDPLRLQPERQQRERPVLYRGAQERVAALPLIGFLLLMPPFAAIFRLDATIAGWPAGLIFLFSVWAVLIIGAALLARSLADQPTRRPGSNRDAPTERGE